jgi:hypothetical protein
MKKPSPEVQQSIEQIRELVAHSESYIRRTGQSLSLKHTCHKFGIYSTTVKKLAPELYNNWQDINFHHEITDRDERLHPGCEQFARFYIMGRDPAYLHDPDGQEQQRLKY